MKRNDNKNNYNKLIHRNIGIKTIEDIREYNKSNRTIMFVEYSKEFISNKKINK